MTAPIRVIDPSAPPTLIPDATPQSLSLEQQLQELRESNKKTNESLSALVGVLQGATQPRQEVYVPPALPTAEEFAADQVGSIARIVDAQTAPLRMFAQQSARDNALTTVKNQIRAQFPDLTQFEAIYDSFIANANIVNYQMGITSYYLAKGKFISDGGNLSNSTNKPVDPLIPAHLRPNSPAVPEVRAGQLRTLNETEERLRREQGMTVADFLYYGGELSAEQYAIVQPVIKK